MKNNSIALQICESEFFGFGRRSKKAEVTTVPSGMPIATTNPSDVVNKDVFVIAANIHDASAKGDNGVNNADVTSLKSRVDTAPDVVKIANSISSIMLRSLWLV
ncbi:hypothetical protein Tco_0983428 [Tanacetum coccineum]